MLMNWDYLCTPVIGSACSKRSEICLLTDLEDSSVPLEDVLTYCMSVTVSATERHAFAAVCWRHRPTVLALYTPSIILTNYYNNQQVHIKSDKKYPDTHVTDYILVNHMWSIYVFLCKPRRGRRRKRLLDDLKDRRGYFHLKEEALDRTMWRNRFGGGFEPVVRQNTEWWWIQTWYLM